ncbi:hypothetical protein HK101_001986, partial [Irineochytrium annulatum]
MLQGGDPMDLVPEDHQDPVVAAVDEGRSPPTPLLTHHAAVATKKALLASAPQPHLGSPPPAAADAEDVVREDERDAVSTAVVSGEATPALAPTTTEGTPESSSTPSPELRTQPLPGLEQGAAAMAQEPTPVISSLSSPKRTLAMPIERAEE